MPATVGAAYGRCKKRWGDLNAAGRRGGRIADALVSIDGGPYPRIDSVKADALWIENTDEAKRSTLFTPASDPDLAEQLNLPDLPDDAVSGDLVDPVASESDGVKRSYHLSRSLREKINAENAQLDLDIRKGSLIALEDAKQLGYTTLRMLRDALRNVGPRIAATVSALTDPFDCEMAINAEIDAVLSSVTVEKMLSESDDMDDDEATGSEA